MIPLHQPLKKAATDAFVDNTLLDAISLADREQAEQWYENFAEQAGGTYSDLARLYNLERAKFLRGQVSRIAGTAPDFAREIGMRQLESIMTHKYQENDQVALKEDFADYLPAGSVGVIFCQYTVTPPAYEITFLGTDGRGVGGIFYEDEIEAVQKVLQLVVRRETVAVN